MAENWGGLCPLLWGGAGCPSNTTSPGSMPTSILSDILIHPAVWPQRTGPIIGHGHCAPFAGGSWVPIQHNVASAEAYLHAKFHIDPSSRLAATYQSHRQTDRTTVRWHRANRLTNDDDAADETLFRKILSDRNHLLAPLLPNEVYTPYQLRSRRHNRQLTPKVNKLCDSNFIQRMLYKDSY